MESGNRGSAVALELPIATGNCKSRGNCNQAATATTKLKDNYNSENEGELRRRNAEGLLTTTGGYVVENKYSVDFGGKTEYLLDALAIEIHLIPSYIGEQVLLPVTRARYD